jgi:hypothetical protein
MLFLFPKKKITVNCFTSQAYVMEYSPIHFAIKHMPEWWKDLPKSYEDELAKNMRKCSGMIEYYKKSITIPMWSDILIKTNYDKSYQWQYSDLQSQATIHGRSQIAGFLNDYGHLKLVSPWMIASEKNIDWVWSHPTYSYPFSSDIACLPGITNFYYQHKCNINIMIFTGQQKKILIKQGQPVALLTPMSDRRIEIVRHLVDEKEIEKMSSRSIDISFANKYKNIIKRKNQFNDCPFLNKR